MRKANRTMSYLFNAQITHFLDIKDGKASTCRKFYMFFSSLVEDCDVSYCSLGILMVGEPQSFPSKYQEAATFSTLGEDAWLRFYWLRWSSFTSTVKPWNFGKLTESAVFWCWVKRCMICQHSVSGCQKNNRHPFASVCACRVFVCFAGSAGGAGGRVGMLGDWVTGCHCPTCFDDGITVTVSSSMATILASKEAIIWSSSRHYSNDQKCC